MTPPADYYESLQVTPTADPEVIQAAYRRLALKYHPDVYHGADAQERMSILNQAYSVLSNPAQRAAYDRQRGGGSSSSYTPSSGGSSVNATPPNPSTGPALRLSTITVDFGAATLGRARTFTLRASNGGKGELSGVVVSHVPWLKATPSEFTGNLTDILIRFQPTATGNYASTQAIEVYSNGGRISVSVRGQTTADSPAAAPTAKTASATGPVTNRRRMDVAKPSGPKIAVPFSAWVVLGALASSIVWFYILPIVSVVPLALGAGLLWDRHMRKPTAAEVEGKTAASRASTLGRCNACGTAVNLARASKCVRCGGAICSSCGACPCGFSKR